LLPSSREVGKDKKFILLEFQAGFLGFLRACCIERGRFMEKGFNNLSLMRGFSYSQFMEERR
jgi:hypothetical protein